MRTVFVYGTLKRGGHWHKALLEGRGDVEFLGEDRVYGWALVPVTRVVPAAVPDQASHIDGELFWLGDKAADEVDKLEGAYRIARVTTAGGVEADMYHMAHNPLTALLKKHTSFPFQGGPSPEA